MNATATLTSLELLGSSQWNLVTARQALDVGVTRNSLTRLTQRGTLVRVRSGVYALPSADHGPLQDLRAAWLATEPATPGFLRTGSADPVTVSGVSAAAVHGIGELIAVQHEFTSPSRRQSTHPDIKFRRRTLPPGTITAVNGLPVTTVVQTVSDIAGAHADYEHLSTVVRDALEKPEVTASALAVALEPHAARHHAASGTALLARMTHGSSVVEKYRDLAGSLAAPALQRAIAELSSTAVSAFKASGVGAEVQQQYAKQIASILTTAAESTVFTSTQAQKIGQQLADSISKGLLAQAHTTAAHQPQDAAISTVNKTSVNSTVKKATAKHESQPTGTEQNPTVTDA